MRSVLALRALAALLPVAALSPTPRTVSRRAALCTGALCAGALSERATAATQTDAYGFIVNKPERSGLQNKFFENVRILLQDSSDALQYGGELAPGGPPSVVPGLQLIPIMQMQATLKQQLPLVERPAEWPGLLEVVTSGPFATLEFKKIFNAYADNIYYNSDSSEANLYLLGGATPSTSQTRQYLLRNEALKWMDEYADELRYQMKQSDATRETEVAREYLENALKTFDEYLKLAPQRDLEIARAAVYKEPLKAS